MNAQPERWSGRFDAARATGLVLALLGVCLAPAAWAQLGYGVEALDPGAGLVDKLLGDLKSGQLQARQPGRLSQARAASTNESGEPNQPSASEGGSGSVVAASLPPGACLRFAQLDLSATHLVTKDALREAATPPDARLHRA